MEEEVKKLQLVSLRPPPGGASSAQRERLKAGFSLADYLLNSPYISRKDIISEY